MNEQNQIKYDFNLDFKSHRDGGYIYAEFTAECVIFLELIIVMSKSDDVNSPLFHI